MANYDLLGNIAIMKFDKFVNLKQKRSFAGKLLRKHKSVTTVLEKTKKYSGRLRTIKTKYLLGERTKEALYKENGCVFRFNVDSCYFSSRLAAERLEIAKNVKRNEEVLVMFGGVAPYAIVIAKLSKAKRVVSVELGRECNKYAMENVKRNKVVNVELIQGDVRKVLPRLRMKFDRIIMPRPNLKDSFLDLALRKVKKSGVINYYGFYNEAENFKLKKLVEDEAKKARKKIKILGINKAGDIAPYKFRYRADLRVLN